MKLKLLAAALVVATSGSAHALILDGNAATSGGNGELFMTLWNQTKETSYILDLNIQMNAFLAGVGTGAAYSYAADANMTTFLGNAAGDVLVWAIGALDNAGATATDYHRYITTASNIDPTSTLTNLQLQAMGTSGNAMLGDVNADIGNNASLIITDPSRVGYAGSAQWGTNWGGTANFTATGAFDSTMDLYLVRQSTAVFAQRHQPSIYEALSFNGQPYQATLDMSGNLYLAPVPEAETYALMLAGLGLVGWMARRRKAV